MGKTTMDGTEQELFENTEIGEYSGWIFLDKLVSGDSVTIRIYVKDVEEDTYKKYLEDTYTGALATPALHVMPMMSKNGLKITMQQSAGTYRNITHFWFKR